MIIEQPCLELIPQILISIEKELTKAEKIIDVQKKDQLNKLKVLCEYKSEDNL